MRRTYNIIYKELEEYRHNFMQKYFDDDQNGWLVYKVMGQSTYYPQPPEWYCEEIPENGREISIPMQEFDPHIGKTCGQGISVATLEWCQTHLISTYERKVNRLFLCRIPYKELMNICIPVDNLYVEKANIKIRVQKLTVLQVLTWKGTPHRKFKPPSCWKQ